MADIITDSVKTSHSLFELVTRLWKDEMKHFEETFEVEIQSQDDLLPWIEVCDKRVSMKNHTFYHLMVLKASYLEFFQE